MSTSTSTNRHVLTLFDLTTAEIERIFAIAADLKGLLRQGIREPRYAGRVIALLFEKPSLRTRVSFETATAHLGGSSLFLGKDVGWGERESTADFAQALSEYIDVLVCRMRSHELLSDLAAHCRVPVINGLTDRAHPCQALADLFTVREVLGPTEPIRLAFVGDGNNVARSLAVACGRLNVSFAIACPESHQFDDAFRDELRGACPRLELIETADPREAVDGAHAVYTDVWASMGQEAEREQRSQAFAPYQVNAELMQLAAPNACFLHCLPARRGEEVTGEVIDGPQSVVFQQAGNRMHVQKALLAWLLD